MESQVEEVLFSNSLLLIGFILTLAGLALRFFPPKKMNWWYGYRLPSAYKSQEHWDFAQKYGGKQLTIWGIVCALLSPSFYLFSMSEEVKLMVVLIVTIGTAVASIALTEAAIRKRFRKK